MADISKINPNDGTVYNIKDTTARNGLTDRPTSFVGTRSEWNALPVATQVKYSLINLVGEGVYKNSGTGLDNIANKASKSFQGTIEEWNALTTAEKKAYDHASIPDSLDGNVTFPASKTMLNDGRSVEDLTKHGYSTYSSIISYTDASNPFVVPDDGYVRVTSCTLRTGDSNTNIAIVASGSSAVTTAIYVRKNTKIYIADVVAGSTAFYIPLS